MVDTVVDIPAFTIELVWDTQVWVVVTPPWEAVTIPQEVDTIRQEVVTLVQAILVLAVDIPVLLVDIRIQELLVWQDRHLTVVDTADMHRTEAMCTEENHTLTAIGCRFK